MVSIVNTIKSCLDTNDLTEVGATISAVIEQANKLASQCGSAQGQLQGKASARMVISQAIVSIKNGLPDAEGAGKSEELHLAHKLIGTMLDEVRRMACQEGSQTSSPDYSKHSGFDCETTPSESPIPSGVYTERISPIVTHTFIDMDVSPAFSAGANETITSVEEPVKYNTNLIPPTRTLEKDISDSKVRGFEMNKILKGERQVIHVPARSCSSELCLPVLQQTDDMRPETTPEFLYNYVEELVKRIVLSHILKPSEKHERMSQYALDSVTINTSHNASPVELLQPVTEFSRASPEVSCTDKSAVKTIPDTVINLTLTSSEALASVSSQCQADLPTAQNTESIPCLSETLDAVPAGLETDRGSSLSILQSPFPVLPESPGNSYACLVSMLVIRLLEEIKDLRQKTGKKQDGLSDVMLDLSQELIEKILSELAGVSGIDKYDSYPQDLKIHQIYRNVYKELIREFGSSEMLQVTFESQDPSFDVSVVQLMTIQLAKTIGSGTTPPADLPGSLSQTRIEDQNMKRVKTRKLMPKVRFWLKVRCNECPINIMTISRYTYIKYC